MKKEHLIPTKGILKELELELHCVLRDGAMTIGTEAKAAGYVKGTGEKEQSQARTSRTELRGTRAEVLGKGFVSNWGT